MIHRYIYTSIETGIEAVADDPEILDALFQEQYSLSDTEMAAIKTYFVDNPIAVSHGFARSEDTFPRIAIILADDSESDPYLGDDAGAIDDEDDEDFGAEVLGSMWTCSFQLLCYADHPDVTSYLYELAKNFMFAALPYLKSVGIQKLGVSGADLMIDPRYVPAHLFGRQLTFRLRYDFTYTDKSSKLGKAFAVAGIHVDKTGSIRKDVGGVKTLVTPYEE